MIVAELREMQEAVARIAGRLEHLITVAIAERDAIEPDRWICEELRVGADDMVADLSEALCGAELMDPVEVTGLAEVRRFWAVRVPIADDGGDIEGVEIERFPTRAEAEAFVAKAEVAPEPQADAQQRGEGEPEARA